MGRFSVGLVRGIREKKNVQREQGGPNCLGHEKPGGYLYSLDSSLLLTTGVVMQQKKKGASLAVGSTKSLGEKRSEAL